MLIKPIVRITWKEWTFNSCITTTRMVMGYKVNKKVGDIINDSKQLTIQYTQNNWR